MPIKTRAARLRADPERELRAWRGVFRSGYDFLHQLADVHVPINELHQPALDATRDAWGRLGENYLAAARPGPLEPWALRTFGLPVAARRPRPLRRDRR